jgi:WD40 repeat protein
VKENLVVVGSRDGTLTFYDGNGKVIKSTREHKSSVCTLSLINNGALVASGSDHPHSEILLWDLSTLEVKARFREHKAAVTAIQCLLDGAHMVSGSYDKKICIYNYW